MDVMLSRGEVMTLALYYHLKKHGKSNKTIMKKANAIKEKYNMDDEYFESAAEKCYKMILEGDA